MLDEVARALVHGPAGTLEFPPSALAGFVARGLALSAGEEVYALVGDLLRFSTFLSQHRGSPKAAQALVTALEPLIVHLEELAVRDRAGLGGPADDLRARFAEQQRALGGTRGAMGALGAKAPEVGVGLRRKR